MRKSILVLAFSLSTPLAAQSIDIGPPPGRLFDVGGHKLHMICSGAGSPTVVLEAGASSFAIDWTLVQREVARTNRVCSYDRAGSGWSDAAEGKSTGVTSDLHSLLQQAGEAPPYVLVGASRGGLLVRLYQAEHPNQVAGLVLVDPSSEERLFTFFEGNAVAIASLTADQLRSTIPNRSVAVTRRSPQTGPPFDKLPADLYEVRIKLDQRLIAAIPDTVSYEIVLSSAERERALLARLRELSSRDAHPLGSLPVVVITRGVDSSQGLIDAHVNLAKLSTNSRHTVIANAGHEIHLFEPAAVITAIADVMASVRSKSPLR